MSISVSPGGLSISNLWPIFITYVDGTLKSLTLQYEDEGPNYLIFALDENIVYFTTIYKSGFEPSGFSAGDITDNDTYRSDFETNYKPTANKQVISPQANSAAHYNGTATTSPATVTFDPIGKSIFIQNTSTLNNLLISFDAGTTFKTLTPGSAFSIDAGLVSIVVKSSAGSVDYESVVAS